MLPLPEFTYHAPKTVDEAVRLLATHQGEAKLLAGGTDLLPNMKHGIQEPSHVIALRGIAELQGIRDEGHQIRIGALTTLKDVAESEAVKSRCPSLALAASLVAGPQLRAMGTLGGNLCLDTRCVYYNQTYFWRKSLGFCLKKDGAVCHVIQGGKRCVAAASNDSAPALLSLGARVRAIGPQGVREIPVDKLYVADGVRNLSLAEDEVLTEAIVPALVREGAVHEVAGFSKLRVRQSIDFPLLSIGVWTRLESGLVAAVRIAVSALGARPLMVKKLEGLAVGKPLSPEVIDALGEATRAQAHPLTNLNVDPAWRREVIPAYVRRAFEAALAESPAQA